MDFSVDTKAEKIPTVRPSVGAVFIYCIFT